MSKIQTIDHKFALSKQYYEKGDHRNALKTLQALLMIEPDHLEANINVSFLAVLLNDNHEALVAGLKATQLGPSSSLAYLHYANALKANGQMSLAIEHYNQALNIDPNIAEALTGLNLIYRELGEYQKAIYYGKKCIEKRADYVDGLSNLAITLQSIGETQQAHLLLKKAVEYAPQTKYLHSNLLMNMQYLSSVSSNESVEYARAFPVNNTPMIKTSPNLNNKLHIGFVSADFRIHPVGFFFRSVLSALSTKNITLSLFANQSKRDEITDELASYADNVINILGLSDQQVADDIAEKGVQVLVDMSGHTAGNRLSVFQLKPAPVQVSWLGYFASTGISQMDYVLMSTHQACSSSQAYFSEKLEPHDAAQFIYSPPHYAPPIQVPPFKIKGYITFGSFNNIAKLNAEVIATWAKVLIQTTNSKLVLKWKSFDDESVTNRIVQLFLSYGVNPARIEIRGQSEHQQMLAEYNAIDIALDPFPFSGALTTCEALWMGKPVISMYQQRPVSRQSYGILRNIGKESWAANTVSGYLNIAKQLTEHPEQIEKFGQDARELLKSSDLMNANQQAEQIELKFRQMLVETQRR